MADPKRIKRRASELRGLKQLHEQVWRDCYQYTFPTRGSGLLQDIVTANEAQQLKARIYDSTAPDGVKTGVATVMGTMVPSNAVWFGLDVGNESEEERVWLDGAAQFMWENIHAANFDAESNDAMTDEWCAGWFVLYLDEKDDGGYYFEAWPVGECLIASTKAAGLVDTLYRCFTYTVSQCVTEYGIENVSAPTREMFNAGKLDEKVKIILAIEPRQTYAVGARLAKNMPFASCHIEENSMHVLRESGYHEFPCMVPRWMRLPGSAYATGPVSDALPDILTLNEMVKWDLMGCETTLAPPMIAEDDGVLNPRNVRLGPRKIIVANSVDSMKPLVTGARVDIAEQKIARLSAGIRKVLMADQLPPAEAPVRTAYEWSIRVQMLRQMLGPMFGRFQSEFLQVLIERAFGIVWRANVRSGFALLGRPPDSLLNRSFTVKYLSPLARSQKLGDVEAMDRFELSLQQEAAIDPSVLDVYDFEAASRMRSQLLGVPQKLVRDKRTTAAVREGKKQAAQDAQQQAIAAQGQAEMQGAMAQRVMKTA